MISAKQLEANRKNAALSTGPRTTRGKVNSRRNAVKHGMSGDGIAMPELEEELVAERTAQLYSALKPLNSHESNLTEQYALEAVRVESCQARERLCRQRLAERALGDEWDEDRAIEAAALGAELSKRPDLIEAQLYASWHGCAWMIRRWKRLGDALEAAGVWTDDQRLLALDLLATPREFRANADLDRLDLAERKSLVLDEIERLEKRQTEVLDARDLQARVAAAEGVGVEADPELRRIRRYEAACKARQSALLKQFQKWRPGMTSDIPPYSSESIERHRAEVRAEKALKAEEKRLMAPVMPPMAKDIRPLHEWFETSLASEPGVSYVALAIGRAPAAEGAVSRVE